MSDPTCVGILWSGILIGGVGMLLGLGIVSLINDTW